MKTQSVNPTSERRGAVGRSLRRLVGVVRQQPGITAAGAGAEMWGSPHMGDLVGARYARPAAKLLNQAKRQHLVHDLWEGRVRRWYPTSSNT